MRYSASIFTGIFKGEGLKLNANAAAMECMVGGLAACSVFGFVRDRRFTPDAGRPFMQDLSAFKKSGHPARAENAHEQNDMLSQVLGALTTYP